jgi:hypothetical protein
LPYLFQRIAKGSVSVGSVAVDLAMQIFGGLQGCKVMLPELYAHFRGRAVFVPAGRLSLARD